MSALGGKLTLVVTILSPFSYEQKHDFDGYEHNTSHYQERECSRHEPPSAFIPHSRKLAASPVSATGRKQMFA
jgi:hypothetical protein